MKKNKYWYGFLEAGEKSSLVLRDLSLETNKADTIYLFNLLRGSILEYNKLIVESKLRSLTEDECDFIPKIESSYKEAKKSFSPRGSNNKKKEFDSLLPPEAIISSLKLDVA